MYYDFVFTERSSAITAEGCEEYCRTMPDFASGVAGFEVEHGYGCSCLFYDGMGPEVSISEYDIADYSYSVGGRKGKEAPKESDGDGRGVDCFAVTEQVVPCP